MNNRKKTAVTIALALSAVLIAAVMSAVFLLRHYSNLQFQTLSGFCRILTEENVADSGAMMDALKKNRENLLLPGNEAFLERFGYRAADFTGRQWNYGYLTAAACLCTGILILLSAVLFWRKNEYGHMQALTEYLEKINLGRQGLLSAADEKEHSRLQDEIFKTVTALYQTRDAALAAKKNYADNLYNIAHQLKTPITAISLSAQMIEEKCASGYARQIQMQAARLSHLEEALLLLSRIDAGTLTLEKTSTAVYTLLTLAADNLQALSDSYAVGIDIPDMGDVALTVDREWTMEALMNLIKNGMEHSPAGTAVHCSYEENPLYVQIRIWDEGRGFDRKDLPHLFERFYRGKNAVKGGIGIGLSLSRELIEMQNGLISAGNLPEGGAYFEIRMYRH